MKKQFLLLFCTLTSLAGFGQTATSIVDSIYVATGGGGEYRHFRLYIPTAYSATTSVPLVFNFHGYSSNATSQESFADFRTIADTANFIVVHPEGTGSIRSFKNFSAPAAVLPDITFIDNLIDSLSADYSIDAGKIFSTGMSNGGFMTYDLACELTSRFEAVASVSGTQIPSHVSVCTPSKPLRVLHIHGTADDVVTYSGEPGTLTMLTYPIHVDSLVQNWVRYNNCSTTPVVDMLPNIDLGDGSSVERYKFSGGDQNTSVILYKVIGGSHSWPGGPSLGGNAANQDFNASLEIWKFFRGYDLTVGEPLAIQDNSLNNTISVFPNPSQGSVTLTVDDFTNASLTIQNILGATVFQQDLQATSTTIELDVPAGIYFYTVKNSDIANSGKIVIE